VPEPIARVEVAALLPPPPRQGAPVTRQSPAAYRGVFVLVRGSRTGPTRLHWTSVNRVVLDDGQADFQPTRTLIGRNNRPVCPVIRIAVGVPAWIGIAKTEGAPQPPCPKHPIGIEAPVHPAGAFSLVGRPRPKSTRRANLVRIPFNEYKESDSFPVSINQVSRSAAVCFDKLMT
jgi:hypothetical protein